MKIGAGVRGVQAAWSSIRSCGGNIGLNGRGFNHLEPAEKTSFEQVPPFLLMENFQL